MFGRKVREEKKLEPEIKTITMEREEFQKDLKNRAKDYQTEQELLAKNISYNPSEQLELETAGTLHKKSAKKKIWERRKKKRDFEVLKETQQMDSIRQQRDAFEKLMVVIQAQKKFKGKDAVMEKLNRAYEFVGDLEPYLHQNFTPEEVENEHIIETRTQALMVLLGHAERALYEAVQELTDSKLEEGRKEAADRSIRSFADSYSQYRQRIPYLIRAKRADVLKGDKKDHPGIDMSEVVTEAKQAVVFQENMLEGKALGGNVSEVERLRKDGKRYYFKEESRSLFGKDSFVDYIHKHLKGAFADAMIQYAESVQKGDTQEGTDAHYAFYIEVESVFGNIIKEGVLNKKKADEVSALLHFPFTDLVTKNPEWWKNFWDGYLTLSTARNQVAQLENDDLGLGHKENMMKRNLATERVAELLGVGHQIVHHMEAYLEQTVQEDSINEQGELERKAVQVRRKGFVMDESDGVEGDEIVKMAIMDELTIHYSPEAMRQIVNQHILDQIILQLDRHANNLFFRYRIDQEKKELLITGIRGIDNDESFGTTLLPKDLNVVGRTRLLAKTTEGEETIYTYEPDIMDRQMYETLMSISPDVMAATVKNLLEPEAVKALKDRYELFRKAVEAKKEKIGAGFLVDKWTEDLQTKMGDKSATTFMELEETRNVWQGSREELLREREEKRRQEQQKQQP